jgi:hypothetical protein
MQKRFLLRTLVRPKLLVSIGVLVGGVVLVGWGYYYTQTPAVGVIRTATTPGPQVEAVASAQLSGVAFAFDYPANYSNVENKTATVPIVEQYMLSKRDAGESRRISVTIKSSMLGSSMLEDSAYTFRKINVENYEGSDVTLIGKAAKKMSKKDRTEITYFIPGEKAYAIIAATSTNPKEAFSQEIEEVVKSFVWRSS